MRIDQHWIRTSISQLQASASVRSEVTAVWNLNLGSVLITTPIFFNSQTWASLKTNLLLFLDPLSLSLWKSFLWTSGDSCQVRSSYVKSIYCTIYFRLFSLKLLTSSQPSRYVSWTAVACSARYTTCILLRNVYYLTKSSSGGWLIQLFGLISGNTSHVSLASTAHGTGRGQPVQFATSGSTANYAHCNIWWN